MAKKVFIGVGHGGKDSGAVANGFKEKDLNLTIALASMNELARHGVSVLMSRTKDENDPLVDEIKECNNFNPDLALDIHNNAGGGDGAEVFHTIGGGTGKTLAQNILNEIVAIGQNSRGLKTKKNSAGKDYFGFIREIKAPSIIVECAFVDNKTDIQIIDTAEEQKKMGIAIAKGVLKTLGIAYIAPVVSKPTTGNKPSTSTNNVVLEWQKAAIADGFRFPKYGADGKWGSECETVAKSAICKKRIVYKYKNLTKIVQKKVGVTADGLFGKNTKTAVIKFQKSKGLTADGVVGLATWKKILGV